MIGEADQEPVDLPAEQRRILRQSALAALLCAGVLVTAMILLPRSLDFPKDLPSRIAFALRADVLLLVCLLTGVRWVSSIRYRSAPDNPGSAYTRPSARLAVPLAYLQNTLEQSFVTVVALTALSTVEGDAPMAYISASVPLFIVGRVAFARGYPKGSGGRAFGMAVTALPGVGAILWVIADMAAELL